MNKKNNRLKCCKRCRKTKPVGQFPYRAYTVDHSSALCMRCNHLLMLNWRWLLKARKSHDKRRKRKRKERPHSPPGNSYWRSYLSIYKLFAKHNIPNEEVITVRQGEEITGNKCQLCSTNRPTWEVWIQLSPQQTAPPYIRFKKCCCYCWRILCRLKHLQHSGKHPLKNCLLVLSDGSTLGALESFNKLTRRGKIYDDPIELLKKLQDSLQK